MQNFKQLALVTPFKLVSLFGLVSLGLVLLTGTSQANAQSNRLAAIVTLILREDTGQTMSDVECEILTYDWGRKPGEIDTVLAKGLTNRQGEVSFDVTNWPRSGYLVRFTDPRIPEQRGYPDVVIGEQNQTIGFVLAEEQIWLDFGWPGAPKYRVNNGNPQRGLVDNVQFAQTVQARTSPVTRYAPVAPPTPDGVQAAVEPPRPATKVDNAGGLIVPGLIALVIGLALVWFFRASLYRSLDIKASPKPKTKAGKK